MKLALFLFLDDSFYRYLVPRVPAGRSSLLCLSLRSAPMRSTSLGCLVESIVSSVLLIFWTGVAGILGTQARHILAVRFRQHWGDTFPWGTLWINLTGSLLIGVILAVVAAHSSWSVLSIPLVIGFLGGYTTFSTLMLESARLRRNGRLLAYVSYLALSGIGGLLFAIGGLLWGGHLA